MSQEQETKTRKKVTNRCPKGTRRNKKTQICESISNEIIQDPQPLALQKQDIENKTRKKITNRCPKGTRRNTKNNVCESLEVKSVDVENKTKKNVTIRCPKGTRRNKKNNICETIQIEPVIDNQPSSLKPDYVDKPDDEAYKPDDEADKPDDDVDKPDSNKLNIENSKDSCDYNLEKDFENCNNTNYYSSETCNNFLLKKEVVERNCINDQPEKNYQLYPNTNDKDFNIKIASKKEFSDTKYDGEIFEDIEKHADELANADFELQPHQTFVKNFLSFQTPYNSLLLYHGLGTGKTCSAIGVCEEMRDYTKQVGFFKQIIIIASENVQDNFKSQLFDERKLKEIDGLWNLKGCVGDKLLKEINPTNLRGISREKIVGQVKSLINANYLFLGYEQFANYIMRKMRYNEELELEIAKQKTTSRKVKVSLNGRIIKRLKNEFDNRLIVIDEVHNIRKTDDKSTKKGSDFLEWLVKSADNMRFLLLSATPMYNSYKEIIWLLNLMNMNDRRGRIKVSDVFDTVGNFKKNGEELLISKATGYISYVRGENPYTFPYRIYPDIFAKEHTFPFVKYPTHQMNLKKIKEEDRILKLYLLKIGGCKNCGDCQYCAYKYIVHKIRDRMPSFNDMDTFGHKILQMPIESLIISYPHKNLKSNVETIKPSKYINVVDENFISSKGDEGEEEEEEEGDEEEEGEGEEGEEEGEGEEGEGEEGEERSVLIGGDNNLNPKELTGKLGMERMMNFDDSRETFVKGNYEYKETTITEYGRIFSSDVIGKYSSKIKSIIDSIQKSEGIVMIYSQYIDSGLIPMALALEEMGFQRYGDTKQLFKEKPSPIIDVRTMKPTIGSAPILPACYAMITGDNRLSPNNENEVKGLTNENNKDGHKIKVILISRAGSEGIDLKFIRQVHILDPWYNMNRIEQIFGRAIRNMSHKALPFAKRNVLLFMYGTILDDNKEESADLYMYRVAEFKSKQIGQVSRVLKESAVDCIINHQQTNFTQEIMSSIVKKDIRQVLSNGFIVNDFKVGDAPFSSSCDYMEKCYYDSKPTKEIVTNTDTYDESYIRVNSEKIMQRIRMLFKEGFFYKNNILINSVKLPKDYPDIQIYAALTQLIEDRSEFLTDKYGRTGRLINIGQYYLFQPLELLDKNASIFDRSVPVDYKHEVINIEINPKIIKPKAKMATDQRIKTIDIFKRNYDIVTNFIGKQTAKTDDSGEKEEGDDAWYKHCGIIFTKLENDYPKTIQYKGFANFKWKLVIAHMIELLMFAEKLELLNYIYSLETMEPDSIELLIKDYFTDITIVTREQKAIVLYDLNVEKIMILKNSKWLDAVPYDIEELKKVPGTILQKINKDEYNKLVGFVGYEKKYKYLVFKTKDMTISRHTGTRCDEAGFKTSEYLNDMIGRNEYTKETNKLKKDKQGQIIQYKRTHEELCVTHELLMRYYHADNVNGKKWFLTPEMAIYHELYKFHF